jgi:hypothetical protein
MNTTLAILPQLSKGFPFQNGQWVGPTQPAATPVVPFAPVTNDSVSLSSQAASMQNGEVLSGCVTVKADGKGISQLLLDRGFSLEEMLQKDEQGLNLIDRTVAANNLRDRNLILPGQELTIPIKEGLAGEEEAASTFQASCSDDDIVYLNDQTAHDSFSHNGDDFYSENFYGDDHVAYDDFGYDQDGFFSENFYGYDQAANNNPGYAQDAFFSENIYADDQSDDQSFGHDEAEGDEIVWPSPLEVAESLFAIPLGIADSLLSTFLGDDSDADH